MLTKRDAIPIPPHTPSEFDHGDVHHESGNVFIAHTQAGTVEALDGPRATHLATIPDCMEASGVLVAQDAGLVFAAARGSGEVLIIDAATYVAQRRIPVDPRPNGLAWDTKQRHLLVADVQVNVARLVTVEGGTLAVAALPGRPRWCVYDPLRERFLVNIREPACVAVLDATSLDLVGQWPIPSAGPHGLAIDTVRQRGYVACDGGQVVQIHLADGAITGQVAIAGAPDAIWHNAQRQRLYVAMGDPGLAQVIDTQTMQVAQEFATELGAHTTAFDVQRQALYVFLPTTCQAEVFVESEEGDDA